MIQLFRASVLLPMEKERIYWQIGKSRKNGIFAADHRTGTEIRATELLNRKRSRPETISGRWR